MEEKGIMTIIFSTLETEEERWDRWSILMNEVALKRAEVSAADLLMVHRVSDGEAEFPLQWVNVRCTWEEMEDLKFQMELDEAYF